MHEYIKLGLAGQSDDQMRGLRLAADRTGGQARTTAGSYRGCRRRPRNTWWSSNTSAGTGSELEWTCA